MTLTLGLRLRFGEGALSRKSLIITEGSGQFHPGKFEIDLNYIHHQIVKWSALPS